VVAPPRVAVLATGEELVPPSRHPGPSQIRDSNSGSIRAALAAWGIAATDAGRVFDERAATAACLAEFLARFEVVVVSGGVSQGEHDHVKPALRDCGVELEFESLHLKPGHPTTYGRHAGGHVFALPGNPVAVMVTLSQVFGPGLRRRLGYPDPAPAPAWGRAAQDLVRRGPRPQFRPVRLEPRESDLPAVHVLPHHGSGDFVSLARADALVFLPADHARVEAGAPVRIHALPGETPG